MMDGSPVCYSRTAIRRRRGGVGEGKEEVIEQRVRIARKHGACVLYMYDGWSNAISSRLSASGAVKPVLKGMMY
jgi:hypothetical protein